MEEYEAPRIIPPEVAKMGGVTSEMARKWSLLQALQDRNETLFYKVGPAGERMEARYRSKAEKMKQLPYFRSGIPLSSFFFFLTLLSDPPSTPTSGAF